jgi:hypothetical protein
MGVVLFFYFFNSAEDLPAVIPAKGPPTVIPAKAGNPFCFALFRHSRESGNAATSLCDAAR